MLSNVGRHARASALRVQIRIREGQLQVVVQDNGCGATPQAFEAPTAYGVMGMRERARHFGGDITIHSAAGQGARFCLQLPLTP
jgi:signal transduction histidine kinase